MTPAARSAWLANSLAVVRGLLLDLLATKDRAGVTEAYERFLQHASVTATVA